VKDLALCVERSSCASFPLAHRIKKLALHRFVKTRKIIQIHKSYITDTSGKRLHNLLHIKLEPLWRIKRTSLIRTVDGEIALRRMKKVKNQELYGI
jgi:hypothetical protein